ncbi:hypothetical protein HPODL_05188 [Ogataea parapolymorpha DL-1]|uniref:Splicing factor subunit n=1 Tax=Ogataea parapolymorpha (strain ATCC 26012 / BCRC 20466 / JCM 22074 / NRRL Y-7560 / DL-1) TaxID=871575 RepID=W1QGE9_OGAPD|nr:hypothetical protein HPODL_05188 [Ogataea parapolymorpha DL-1]ESX00201.1 hypothetical protein HPODL_05188 [Ogataea parapolymorpha DL-1]
MADKIREKQLYEALKSKHIGLGNEETTRTEYISNIKRDTYASLVAHPAMLEFLSNTYNKPRQIVHTEMIEKMIRPMETNK